MKTKEWEDQVGKGLYKIFCAGCNTVHSIWAKPSEYPHPVWGFNGNLDKPTFTPSVRITWPEQKEDGTTFNHCCHFNIVDGRIEFCGDCTHALSGQVLELPDIS